jgi:hypothetical protein
MNINACGLIEFRATMQPASQVGYAASQVRACDQPQDCEAFGLVRVCKKDSGQF